MVPGDGRLAEFRTGAERNGCAERFVRALKENPSWVRAFAHSAELPEALREFKRSYNERWPIGRHGHRRPSRVRRDLIGGDKTPAWISSSLRPECPVRYNCMVKCDPRSLQEHIP